MQQEGPHIEHHTRCVDIYIIYQLFMVSPSQGVRLNKPKTYNY